MFCSITVALVVRDAWDKKDSKSLPGELLLTIIISIFTEYNI